MSENKNHFIISIVCLVFGILAFLALSLSILNFIDLVNGASVPPNLDTLVLIGGHPAWFFSFTIISIVSIILSSKTRKSELKIGTSALVITIIDTISYLGLLIAIVVVIFTA
ncbi:MAG TPA: hypothetical protein VMX55_14060 [candidate division Zixibacteria bacterium]|nr:hypothetical protein [candidate division Zixibacteria bacterium]